MNSFRNSLGIRPDVNSRPDLLSRKKTKQAKADDLGSVSIRRKQQRMGNARADDRHAPPLREAKLWTGEDQPVVVDLVNLSAGGAMIEGEELNLALWDEVRIELADVAPIGASVRWIRDHRFGLEFVIETEIEATDEQRDNLLLDSVRALLPEPDKSVIPERKFEPQKASWYKAEVRYARRHPLIWEGQVESGDDLFDLRLRNISETGALVEVQGALSQGEQVIIALEGTGRFLAKVSWYQNGQAGLTFPEKFDLAQLANARVHVVGQKYKQLDHLANSDMLAAEQEVRTKGREDWRLVPSLEQLQEDLAGFLGR